MTVLTTTQLDILENLRRLEETRRAELAATKARLAVILADEIAPATEQRDRAAFSARAAGIPVSRIAEALGTTARASAYAAITAGEALEAAA